MDDEKRREIREGFVRQRRNLLIVSCILLLATGSEMSVEAFEAFGAKVHIAPGSVALVLWVLWFYWILRYWQYYHDLPDKEWREVFFRFMHKRVATRIGDLGQAEIRKREHGRRPKEDFLVTGYRVKQVDILGWNQVGWRGSVTLEKQINVVDKSDEVVNVSLTHRQLTRDYARSLAGLVLHTRLVSEYGLPLAVAALPPLYVGYIQLVAA